MPEIVVSLVKAKAIPRSRSEAFEERIPLCVKE